MAKAALLLVLFVFVYTIQASFNPRITIPAYFDPTSSSWSSAESSSSTVNAIIANPNSGPGDSQCPEYSTGISAAISRGIAVYGYVHTSYGSRSVSDINQDISNWFSFYSQISGIFLDEVSTESSLVSWYNSIASTIHSHKANVPIILNPGAVPDVSYLTIPNSIVVLFEDTYSNFQHFSAPSYVSQYTADRFYIIVYGASSSSISTILSKASSANTNNIYITDQNLPNPYGQLPSYWSSSLVPAIQNYVSQNPAPTSTPAPTRTSSPTTAPTHASTPAPTTHSSHTTAPTPAPTSSHHTTAPTSTPAPSEHHHSRTPTTDPVQTVAPTQLTNSCFRSIIPAYTYPSSSWTSMYQNGVEAIIINPSSGSGSSIDQNYVTAITQAQQQGVLVLGYVWTNYGSQSLSSVKSQIDNYKAWYAVDGIYVDAVSSLTSQLSYYSTLSNYIRENDSLSYIVFGIGAYPQSGEYISLANTTVTYSGTFSGYSAVSLPTYATQYSADKFMHIVYDTAASSLQSTLQMAASYNVQYVYITDETTPNPYCALPSYWSTLTASLSC